MTTMTIDHRPPTTDSRLTTIDHRPFDRLNVNTLDALATSLADRYKIERELGHGGMACRSVAKATTRLLSLKRRGPGIGSHFSDTSRVAASAADRQIRDPQATIDHRPLTA